MNIATFLADPHGSRFASLAADPDFGPALRAGIALLAMPDVRVRMVDAVDRYDHPALAAVTFEIEALPEFRAAVAGKSKDDTKVIRIRQAFGVAAKLIMGQHGFVPRFTPEGAQDQGRLEHVLRVRPTWFTTARRYQRLTHASTATP